MTYHDYPQDARNPPPVTHWALQGLEGGTMPERPTDPKMIGDVIALVVEQYKGNPRYAARIYLKEVHRDDYDEFLDCRKSDPKTPKSAQHVRALDDLVEYRRPEYDDMVALLMDRMRSGKT